MIYCPSKQRAFLLSLRHCPLYIEMGTLLMAFIVELNASLSAGYDVQAARAVCKTFWGLVITNVYRQYRHRKACLYGQCYNL